MSDWDQNKPILVSSLLKIMMLSGQLENTLHHDFSMYDMTCAESVNINFVPEQVFYKLVSPYKSV